MTLKGQIARAAEFPGDLGAGTLLFQSAAGFDPAAPLATDVRISVAGVVARVVVTQRFQNPGAEYAEAVYAFPLPDDAAVDGMSMQIGERLIEGEIREREQAERVYTAARQAGQRASLVRQKTPNLFTTAVANIAPGEAIDVTIEYLQTARFDAGEFSLRFPMTLTPRYGERHAAAASAPPASGAPEIADAAPSADASNEASVRAVLAPGLPLERVHSAHHEIEIVRDGERYVIATKAPRVPMDRDFVISWRPQVGASPAVAALTETRDGTTYALLMMVPPADTHAYRVQPREWIYVIDTSGSMAGESLEQAQAAMQSALGRLTDADRFNLFQFNSTTSSLHRAPVAVTAESRAAALRYVERLGADGGTEIEPALRAALAQPAAAGYLRQVVFLTDGGVSNESDLFGVIKQSLGAARLFTIGIGAAPNSYFMRKAAEFGRGTYTHIASTAEVADATHALLAKLEHVALTDVLIEWPEAVEFYPHRAPDLYAGEPLVVAASFPAGGGQGVDVKVHGRVAGMPWSQAVTAGTESLPGIAALWARRKIEYLMDSRVDGVHPDLIRTLVIDVALEHGLVSPHTSLVAVDKTPARSAAAALERRTVSNMLPAGADWGMLPQTATSAPLYRFAGLALLVLGLVVLGARRLPETRS
jgi:Ca-activated chloride channel family protein